jgi:hypothetical protein
LNNIRYPISSSFTILIPAVASFMSARLSTNQQMEVAVKLGLQGYDYSEVVSGLHEGDVVADIPINSKELRHSFI